MKVILLQNVPKVGKKYELVEVAPGYARNFLYARGLCEIVTRSNVAKITELQKRRSLEATKESARLNKAATALDGVTLEIAHEANEEGHLYAQVSANDIANAIESKVQIAIPANHVHIPSQIKALGEHKVTVTVGDKDVALTINVIAA